MKNELPEGFVAAGVSAGIKQNGNLDLALIVNTGSNTSAAAVFTKNRVFAAPVAWSKKTIAQGKVNTVLLNSGGANACTGEQGLADVETCAKKVAGELNREPNEIAVCSTGLIGQLLPMEKMLAGIEKATQSLSPSNGEQAAKAIMTTDTFEKVASEKGNGYQVWGMAKGAGMLAPALATMLVVLTTDAKLDSTVLDRSLRKATSLSFDRLDSDGCMSTNDTVICLSSGASEVTPEELEFTTVLAKVCHQLAMGLLSDAEGASHDIAITVQNAASEDDALTVGREIARSNLFKCAVFGNDPNWGRVLSAIGVTNAKFDPAKLDVYFNNVQVCRSGGIGDDRNLVDLSGRKVEVLVDLHAGNQSATIYTNDLTYGYVKENAEYSS